MSGDKKPRTKSNGLPERAALLLCDLYIRDEEIYSQRIFYGSKKEKTPRQLCVAKWVEELAAIGCERTEVQIYQRIKGDLNSIRARIALEKEEKGNGGESVTNSLPKLDTARQKLYDHLSGSHETKEEIDVVAENTEKIKLGKRIYPDDLSEKRAQLLDIEIANAKKQSEILELKKLYVMAKIAKLGIDPSTFNESINA